MTFLLFHAQCPVSTAYWISVLIPVSQNPFASTFFPVQQLFLSSYHAAGCYSWWGTCPWGIHHNTGSVFSFSSGIKIVCSSHCMSKLCCCPSFLFPFYLVLLLWRQVCYCPVIVCHCFWTCFWEGKVPMGDISSHLVSFAHETYVCCNPTSL